MALLALGLGRAAVSVLGETMAQWAGPLLIVFGLLYALWSWRKGGHFHPGGALLHRGDGACDGHEGDANDEHLHYHADQALIRDRGRFSATGLAVLVGTSPNIIVSEVRQDLTNRIGVGRRVEQPAPPAAVLAREHVI